jgi:hypothetical protein
VYLRAEILLQIFFDGTILSFSEKEKLKTMCIQHFDPRKVLVLLLALSILVSVTAFGQQDLIANKMNTRTDVTKPFSNAVGFGNFTATRLNGLNEIRWSGFAEQNTNRYVVEYSTDGINYRSAGEMLATNGQYELKHHIFETAPLLYRVKSIGADGKYVYSNTIYLDGYGTMPVKIYPTIITGYTVNAIASMPVERITVTTSDGQQVYMQSVNGKDNYLNISLPTSLAKGSYLISFTGNGWQSTEKFIIP